MQGNLGHVRHGDNTEEETQTGIKDNGARLADAARDAQSVCRQWTGKAAESMLSISLVSLPGLSLQKQDLPCIVT